MVVCTDWWADLVGCQSLHHIMQRKQRGDMPAFLADMSPLFQFSFIIELPIIFTKEKLI